MCSEIFNTPRFKTDRYVSQSLLNHGLQNVNAWCLFVRAARLWLIMLQNKIRHKCRVLDIALNTICVLF
jgi:hypothetical protein